MSSPELDNVDGIKYKFYVNNDDNEEPIVVIGNSDDTFTFEKQYKNVFCYGKEVSDFHSIDKSTLFTLNFSATQEIDKQQQEQLKEIETLKTENIKLTNKIDSQQSEIDLLKTQIAEILAKINK